MGVMDVFDRGWSLWRQATAVHVAAYRLTRGLVGYWIPGAAPTLLLEHVGAKSGARRTTPLSFVEDGDRLVLVASKGGHPRHPAWYHNLLAHPDVVVQVRSERRPVRARRATPSERERLWPRVVAAYRGYEAYQSRTERQIPLMILEPR